MHAASKGPPAVPQELKGGEAAREEALQRLSAQLSAMRSVGMASLVAMLERLEARVAGMAQAQDALAAKGALAGLWEELDRVARAQERAGEALRQVSAGLAQGAARTGAAEAALRALAGEQDKAREAKAQLAARLEAHAARAATADAQRSAELAQLAAGVAAAGAPGRAAAAGQLEARVSEMDDALGQLAGAVRGLTRDADGQQSQLRLVQDTLRLVDAAVEASSLCHMCQRRLLFPCSHNAQCPLMTTRCMQSLTWGTDPRVVACGESKLNICARMCTQALKGSAADHGEALQRVGPLCARAASLEGAVRAVAAEQDEQREALHRLHAEGLATQGGTSSEAQSQLAARVEALAAMLAQAGARHSAEVAALAAGLAERGAGREAAGKLEARVADIDGELGHVGAAVRDMTRAAEAQEARLCLVEGALSDVDASLQARTSFGTPAWIAVHLCE